MISSRATGIAFCGRFDGVCYDEAGQPTELRFANGAGTAIARDAQHRPQSYAVWGSPTTGKPFWSSGTYAFDGAGNITAIGAQHFGYDGASRLTHAELLPQAQSPTTQTFDVVNWTYDLYGNMTGQTLVGSSAVTPPPLTFQHTFGTAGPANHNQVTTTNFAYDGNGNTRRFTGQLGTADAVGALWDAQNRLTAFFQGDPWSGSAPGEWYAYDADGYRFLRLSRDSAGKAVLSLRDGEGRTLSEFVDEPSGGLKLARDFVYGVGQLLVERRVANPPPTMALGSPPVSGGSYHLTLTGGSGAPSYELDIRTASGFQNRLTGLQPDAGQQLHVPESALSPGETNALRLRAEGDPGTGYSIPVSLLYDPSVTSSSPNQIRSLGVSRSGTDLVLRWSLLSENGKQTKVSFRRADTGTTYLLTPQALASPVKTLTLSSQALASPCGDFLLTQVLQTSETGATPPLRNPSGESGTQGTEVNPCDDPPPGSPPAGPSFANAYHHRDHLGTLRDVTDDGGYLVAGFDWYPYGTRMATGATTAPEDSRRLFTGHERDLATGLDYMMARYYGSSLSRFLSTDPVATIRKNLGNPQRWNRYVYSLNSPLTLLDPDGQDAQLADGMSRTDKNRMVTALAKAARNPEFKQKLQNIDVSDKKVTYGTGSLRNDIRDNPGTITGTVRVGQTDPTPAGATPATLTGAKVTVDFSNVDFSQKTTDPKSDVETVSHETSHAESILNNTPATQTEEDAALQFGHDVDADPNTKAEPTRKEKKEIKKILEPKK